MFSSGACAAEDLDANRDQVRAAADAGLTTSSNPTQASRTRGGRMRWVSIGLQIQ